jgi:hypothetical protein
VWLDEADTRCEVMTKWICAGTSAAIMAAAVAVAASDTFPADGDKSTPGRIGVSTAARAASIFGTAWRGDNSPIADARLRLRNVITGRTEATTVANEDGRFTFSGIEGGTYVVELVSESGKILAVGQVFAISSGETVATFVRLGTRVPWYTSFFSNAAAAATTAAAAQGVTALAPVANPVTRDR